jgi:two-component system, NtrC family, sensor kinase
VLPGTALLVLAILRERISRPLQDLNNLLALIGEGRSSAQLEDVGVPLRPIMESYNRLVDQLADALSQNREYQGRLESEVRAAAGTLIRQQLELAEADRLAAVGEISARVAHELKNPLAGIQMALSNLKDDIDVPDQLNRLQLVADEVARMARLLDQLLVHPHRSPEPCQDTEIRTLVADLLALLRYQISGRILLKNGVDRAAQWRLQRDVLRQVLLNLVLNAAQAIGESAGTIEVTAAREGHALRLSIIDDGPGFPPDVLADGIRPFQTSRSGGMGLGLSTVERMVRAMGGRIELSNREPRGAIASVLLGSTRVQ